MDRKVNCKPRQKSAPNESSPERINGWFPAEILKYWMVVSSGCARAQRFGKIPLRFRRYPFFRLNGACQSTSETSPMAKDFWSNLLNLKRRLPKLNEVVNENLGDLQGIS
jgi:hypothetical protein